MVVAVISVLLSACVSNTDYMDLKDKVASLEKRIDKLESEYGGANNSEEIDKEIKESVNADASSAEEENKNKSDEASSNGNYLYYIDNLSNDEVVAEIMSILENVPAQGQTFDYYENTWKVVPYESRSDYGPYEYKFSKEGKGYME